MQLALYGSIAWRHPLGLGQALQWAAEFGWDLLDGRGMSLDIPGTDPRQTAAFGYDMLGPNQVSHAARRDLRRRLEQAGKGLLGIYCAVPVNLPPPQGESCLALVGQYVALAADLGAVWLRPINNFAIGDDPADAQRDVQRTIAGLQTVAAEARRLGIGLLLENNENTLTPDAASLLTVRQALAPHCRVGIAFDAANAYFQGLDPAAELAALAGSVDVLHLKNVRRHAGRRWDYVPRGDFSYQWCTLAEGDLDWTALLRQAWQQGFDGPLVYEYANPFKGMPREYWDMLPEPAEAAHREAEFLRRTWRLVQSAAR